MIIVNGYQAETRELLQRYPPRGIEADCAQILAKSAATYSYGSYETLDFELALRREIVNSAAGLARAGLQFEIFRQSYCNRRYWLRTADGGFDLRRGAAPSAAIRDIFTNGRAYGTECATAMQIVYYGAVLSVVGDGAFDRMFGAISLMDWQKLPALLRETGLLRPISDALPGDRRYFANPDVNLMTPEWQGENVIDMGDGTYYGHGMGRADGADIIAELNRNRRNGAARGAYLMHTAGVPDFNKLYSAYTR